ncbi:uncharacterized protein EDB91DRAFT_1246640 [Suillus paluster]|uniref:uncharacterized protein n=1 Tax=Suillus paluster TaxID=48578 RepID=UPI001B865000|nr:uncharacterized protein EDB91DRAFT_1246640 [Suillus paluster]KAG1745134.1 hypothetical protein EDB91DRAFT_1246640 [Suillus paluster]
MDPGLVSQRSKGAVAHSHDDPVDGQWNMHKNNSSKHNNTFTVCPNQVSPSASLPTSTSVPTTTLAGIGAASAVPSSSANSTSSSAQGAIIGGAVGGAAFAIIAVLGGVFLQATQEASHDPGYAILVSWSIP